MILIELASEFSSYKNENLLRNDDALSGQVI